MKRSIITFLLLALALPSLAFGNADKVTICHAAGLATNPKYVTLTISKHAVYKEQGGHFYENGTPQAGHEQDYFGPCLTDTPSPSNSQVPTPSPKASDSPSERPTSGPTAPSVTPQSEKTPNVMPNTSI